MQIERYKTPELNPKAEVARLQSAHPDKQSRQLLMALALLLVVLAVVLVKNRDFWFGSDELVETDSASSQDVAKAKPPTPSAEAGHAREAHAPVAKKQVAQKTSAKVADQKITHEGAANPGSPVVATKRVVLPPLDVEVVAGDTHRTVHPGTNVAIAAIPGDSNRAATLTTSVATLSTNAAERERLSPVSAPDLQQTIDSSYPLLGQHTRVQGSVVLEAIVGADGAIEGLRVISGPAILSTAAQQAVRQWRFKPYLQNGQPVETKARITVNFSIRISDNPATTS